MLSMFYNDKIINSCTTITICIYIYIYTYTRKCICTNIHKYTHIQFKYVDQLDSSAVNGPTEQNTVDYIGHQLETY